MKGYLQKTVEGVHNLACSRWRRARRASRRRRSVSSARSRRSPRRRQRRARQGRRAYPNPNPNPNLTLTLTLTLTKVAELRHEATDAMMAVPDRAQGAKAALFSQQQAARDKLRLARQKKLARGRGERQQRALAAPRAASCPASSPRRRRRRRPEVLRPLLSG